MSAKPLDPKTVESIVIDWRIGQLSQQDLADKYKVSKGVVNKYTKGIPQDGRAIVNAGVQYNQALKEQDDRMVTAIEKTVSLQVERVNWIHGAAIRNANDAMKAPCTSQKEFHLRANTLGKTKETLVGKDAQVAVQVNTQVNTMPASQFEDIATRLLNR